MTHKAGVARLRLPRPSWAEICATFLLLTFALGTGLQVLHFAVTSHQWCELHKQIEHRPPALSDLVPCNRGSDQPSLAAARDRERDADHRGCSVLAAQLEKATWSQQTVAAEDSMEAAQACWVANASVAYTRAPLSVAPKRSPTAARV